MDVTSEASEALAPGEALVFDWHRVAICCAVAGEVSLRRTSMREVERSGSFARLSSSEQVPVFAHRRAYAPLADRAADSRLPPALRPPMVHVEPSARLRPAGRVWPPA
jgi:hypothetical protein